MNWPRSSAPRCGCGIGGRHVLPQSRLCRSHTDRFGAPAAPPQMPHTRSDLLVLTSCAPVHLLSSPPGCPNASNSWAYSAARATQMSRSQIGGHTVRRCECAHFGRVTQGRTSGLRQSCLVLTGQSRPQSSVYDSPSTDNLTVVCGGISQAHNIRKAVDGGYRTHRQG